MSNIKTTTVANWTPDSLRAITYNAEQQAAIDLAVADTANTLDGFLTYTWSSALVQLGNQTFADFGTVARELIDFSALEDEHGTRFEYLPALVDGRMLQQWPDEGQTGVLYLVRRTHQHGVPATDEWDGVYLHRGWLWSNELTMSREEITDRIVDDVLSGKNVWTRRPPGWA